MNEIKYKATFSTISSGDLLKTSIAKEAIDASALASAFAMDKSQLAAMAGVPEDFDEGGTSESKRSTQNRLREVVEVLHRIEGWAGSRPLALAWYRSQSIAAFGDQTAESLVKTGKADALREFLDGIAVGGYA